MRGSGMFFWSWNEWWNLTMVWWSSRGWNVLDFQSQIYPNIMLLVINSHPIMSVCMYNISNNYCVYIYIQLYIYIYMYNKYTTNLIESHEISNTPSSREDHGKCAARPHHTLERSHGRMEAKGGRGPCWTGLFFPSGKLYDFSGFTRLVPRTEPGWAKTDFFYSWDDSQRKFSSRRGWVQSMKNPSESTDVPDLIHRFIRGVQFQSIGVPPELDDL